MPEVRRCSIYGCRSNSRDHKDLRFFNFPSRDTVRSMQLYNTWITVCHESAEALRFIRRPYICSNHFEPWETEGSRRLAPGSVPSLLLQAPPGFAEEELARVKVAKEKDAMREKELLLKLINDSVFRWIERAQYHPDIGPKLCTARRELQQVGIEIRNLLGATLTFHIDDHWLSSFRKTHLANWDHVNGSISQQTIHSLDLVEIIKSIDPNAKISGRTPSEYCPSSTYSQRYTKFEEREKRHLKKEVDKLYVIGSKSNKSYNEVNSETQDSLGLSDDGYFDVNLEEDRCVEVVCEPIIETYQQALDHLKPLEDFAFRQENYRIIGLLSQLEIILKKSSSSDVIKEN